VVSLETVLTIFVPSLGLPLVLRPGSFGIGFFAVFFFPTLGDQLLWTLVDPGARIA
jgi:hypothetical protein